MIGTEFSPGDFAVFSAIWWLLVITFIGAIASRRVKVDNIGLLFIIVFGLGSTIIVTTVGAAIANWVYDSIELADEWAWALVAFLIVVSAYGIFRRRDRNWPYVILVLLGLAFMLTPPGLAIANGVSYGLQWSTYTLFNLVGWDMTGTIQSPF